MKCENCIEVGTSFVVYIVVHDVGQSVLSAKDGQLLPDQLWPSED